MLKIHWIEILFRGIPESFLVLIGVTIIAEKLLPIKKLYNLQYTTSPLYFLC